MPSAFPSSGPSTAPPSAPAGRSPKSGASGLFALCTLDGESLGSAVGRAGWAVVCPGSAQGSAPSPAASPHRDAETHGGGGQAAVVGAGGPPALRPRETGRHGAWGPMGATLPSQLTPPLPQGSLDRPGARAPLTPRAQRCSLCRWGSSHFSRADGSKEKQLVLRVQN